MLRKLHGKLVGVATGAIVMAGNAMAGTTPSVPATALEADYALFDWVFGGVVVMAMIFATAKRTKGFVR